MSGPWVVAELAAWLAIAALVSFGALVGVAYRRMQPDLRNLDPKVKERVLVAVACMPWALAGMLVVACFLPSLADWVGIAADHCLDHGARHPHLCFQHSTELERSGAIGVLGGLLAVALLGLLGAACREALESARAIGNLAVLSSPDPEFGVSRLGTDRPMVFTVGIFRPRIFLSDGLRNALRPDDLAVVLAHEQGHVERRDGLRKLVVAALSVALPPSTRRLLLADHAETCEQRCDERAADRSGDPARVAGALLQVSRLDRGATPGFGVGDARTSGGATARRVRTLLEPAMLRSGRDLTLALGVLAISVGLIGTMASGPLHHAAETGLAFLF